MAIKVEAAPFQTTFGDCYVQQREDWLYCTEKNVKIFIKDLVKAVKLFPKLPINTKVMVGLEIVRSGDPEREFAYMWRDEHKYHIACLSEPRDSFNKKYIELVKHLNNSNNVRTERSDGSTVKNSGKERR